MKSLFNPEDLEETRNRIFLIKENFEPKWGRMNAAQMFRHCDKILQVALGKLILPKRNLLIQTIGIITKIEMKIFNNGIPRNMPTFDKVKVSENCNFEKSRENLLKTLDEFIRKAEKKTFFLNTNFLVK